LSFPPKGRSKNPDLSAPVRESDGHDPAEDFAKAKIPLFIIAVKRIVKDNKMLILEYLLRILKIHQMENMVHGILLFDFEYREGKQFGGLFPRFTDNSDVRCGFGKRVFWGGQRGLRSFLLSM
jgi:hypothetical protein